MKIQAETRFALKFFTVQLFMVLLWLFTFMGITIVVGCDDAEIMFLLQGWAKMDDPLEIQLTGVVTPEA